MSDRSLDACTSPGGQVIGRCALLINAWRPPERGTRFVTEHAICREGTMSCRTRCATA